MDLTGLEDVHDMTGRKGRGGMCVVLHNSVAEQESLHPGGEEEGGHHNFARKFCILKSKHARA